MTKPQPWYAAFNQAPKGNPHHGRNRKPTPTTHGDPASRTSPANDRADSLVTWEDIPSIPQRSPTIPHAGIRAGEIIGHRCWLVTDAGLCSIAHHRIWVPGETVVGDIDEVVSGLWFGTPIYGGVYSFATPEQLISRMPEIEDMTFPYLAHFSGGSPTPIHDVVIGTIKCWGEVIEHEYGWRSHYAKLNSLGFAVGPSDINALRKRYLP